MTQYSAHIDPDRDALLHALGAAVRSRRSALGLTLRALGERAHVSQRFLVQLEGGSGNISVARLADVAIALGTTPASLLASAEKPPRTLPRHVALVGLRGAGKSSIGARIAEACGAEFVELDAVVAKQSGMTLSTIFEVHGEAWFHRAEREALSHLLAADRPVVVATGGSLVTHAGTWSMLRSKARTIWLAATPEDHWRRVVAQGDGRPMRGRPEAMKELDALLATRAPLYAMAESRVDTSSMSLEEAVQEALGLALRAAVEPTTTKGKRR